MQYYYKTSLNGLTTKPLDIYCDTKRIGVVRGYFDNMLKRFIDEILNSRFPPSFLKYNLSDYTGDIRLIAETKGFFKGNIEVTYYDNNNNKHIILMENMKSIIHGSKKVEFTYNGAKYFIYRERSNNPFNTKSAEMYIGKKLVANWKIYIKENKVVVNIFDFEEEKFLILGLFHAYLYATKG